MQRSTETLADLIRQKLSNINNEDKLLVDLIRQKLTAPTAPRSPWLQASFLKPVPTVVRRVFGI
jgi:hypothetical protein